MAVTADPGPRPPPRVFISYAHASDEHVEAVRSLWILLRTLGIDAQLDRLAAQRRQDWPVWMMRQVREADFVLVVASEEYCRRAEGRAGDDEGRGVQFEAAIIRDAVYAAPNGALDRFLPVLLPGEGVAGIPAFLGPNTTTHYLVDPVDEMGVEQLLRVLAGLPMELEPRFGVIPTLPPRGAQRRADPEPERLKVFLCHASEDKATVKQWATDLDGLGYDVWLDSLRLLPGDDWEHEIRAAVDATDVVVVALSAGSLNKVGFVQKEIRMVLDAAEERPPGRTFVFPVRLDDSPVPQRLNRLHWVDARDDGWLERLDAALRKFSEWS